MHFASDLAKVNPGEVRYLKAWTFPEDRATRFGNPALIFSTGAGIDQVVGLDLPPRAQLVRMVEEGLRLCGDGRSGAASRPVGLS